MRILYGIQGTGNGHLTRAMSLVPKFSKYAQVDVLLSGIQADIDLPFPVKYRYHGMSFIFGKRGGIDYLNTCRKNYVRKFMKEVRSLDVTPYDIVISDFEPITSWACIQANVPCIGLSNQATLLSKGTPRPKKDDFLGRLLLHNYAPTTAAYGFHYEKYNESIFLPIIRDEVRQHPVSNEGHYTVYLPAFDDSTIVKALSRFHDVKWQVFTKCIRKSYIKKNINVHPVESKAFLKSMTTSAGIVCAAGFGTTTEAMFLGKKLLVVPQKSQYEQQCNAAALKKLGVPKLKSLKEKHDHVIDRWLHSSQAVHLTYPDETDEIVQTIVADHYMANDPYIHYLSKDQYCLDPA